MELNKPSFWEIVKRFEGHDIEVTTNKPRPLKKVLSVKAISGTRETHGRNICVLETNKGMIPVPVTSNIDVSGNSVMFRYPKPDKMVTQRRMDGQKWMYDTVSTLEDDDLVIEIRILEDE